MKITVISDTHTKHHQLDLPGGDILIHAGDLMNAGYSQYEIKDFCRWFETQQYDKSIFIAGNHDRLFENEPELVEQILDEYFVHYLQDSELTIGEKWETQVKIWGSPWQPEFYNWAFNLPRCGSELEEVWSKIPIDTDILVTHGPPQGILDISGAPYNEPNLGCELLRVKVDEQPPKIHVFGHIHGSWGYKFHNGTHFINAAVLGENYNLRKDAAITFEWDPETNKINFN